MDPLDIPRTWMSLTPGTFTEEDDSQLIRLESKDTSLHRIETPGSTQDSVGQEAFQGWNDEIDFADGSSTESFEDITEWLIATSKRIYGDETCADLCLQPQYVVEDPMSPASSMSPTAAWNQEPKWAQLLPFHLCRSDRLRLSDVTAAFDCYTKQEPVVDRKLSDGWLFQEHEDWKDFKSMVYWPMVACGRCIGVVHLLSPDIDTFAAKDARYKAVLSITTLRFLRAELESQAQVQSELLQSMYPAHVWQEIVATRLGQASDNLEPSSVAHGSGWGRMISSGTATDLDSPMPMSRCKTTASDRCSRQQAISRGLPKITPKALTELGKLLYSDYHHNVTVLFADIKDFTPLSANRGPAGVMLMLDELFKAFDEVIESFEPMAFKVETVGDAYVVACGLMPEVRDDEDPSVIAMTSLRVAAALHQAAATITDPIQIRIGLHSGDVMSGIIGKRAPRYGLFGDTVNTASRMESNGVAGKIHVSESFKQACDPCNALQHITFQPCGSRKIKGKGEMHTYLVDPTEVLSMRNIASSMAILDPVKDLLQGALVRSLRSNQ